ncbi:hypothetical protein GIB67_038112, partial [Kingdonia uniflora]
RWWGVGMESGDIHSLSSLHWNSSSIWRSNAADVFSRSSRDEVEDDEEAFSWAAIKKLPTYLRIRRGILSEEEGDFREVDIGSLDFVVIEIPTIEVRFDHLNITVEAHGFLNYLHILPSRKQKISVLHEVSGIIKPSK